MRFEFATSARIVFGPGTLGETKNLIRGIGRHALVVTGRNPGRAEPLFAQLKSAGIAATFIAIDSEPSTHDITRASATARAAGCDFVIGMGGGAALDAAKATAALLTNPGDVLEYLEVVGAGRPLACACAPCVAIPTTAGTGSEVTRNAVLAVPASRVKVSLRSASMLPQLALVDPDLTRSLPPAITASTGLDALTQLIEPYVSGRAQPLTDALCVEGIRRIARALRTAVHAGTNSGAREDMALASLFGGLALANAGLGAVHGFAGPIGGMFPAPHGAVCAALLPFVMEANLEALSARAPHHPAPVRYEEIARLVTGHPQATAADGIAWIRTLITDLGIPPLGTYGITRADIPALVASSARASSMQANPIVLTSVELETVLARALQA